MDTRFLNAAAFAAVAAFMQMTPAAHAFGVRADFALVALVFLCGQMRPFAAYAAVAALPPAIFFLSGGLGRESVIFYAIAIVAYGISRSVSWQPWFVYYFLLVFATIGAYAALDRHFLAGSPFSVAREVAVNLIFGAALYACMARFSRSFS